LSFDEGPKGNRKKKKRLTFVARESVGAGGRRRGGASARLAPHDSLRAETKVFRERSAMEKHERSKRQEGEEAPWKQVSEPIAP
jgi:hypothetical protein